MVDVSSSCRACSTAGTYVSSGSSFFFFIYLPKPFSAAETGRFVAREAAAARASNPAFQSTDLLGGSWHSRLLEWTSAVAQTISALTWSRPQSLKLHSKPLLSAASRLVVLGIPEVLDRIRLATRALARKRGKQVGSKWISESAIEPLTRSFGCCASRPRSDTGEDGRRDRNSFPTRGQAAWRLAGHSWSPPPPQPRASCPRALGSGAPAQRGRPHACSPAPSAGWAPHGGDSRAPPTTGVQPFLSLWNETSS